MKWIVGLGNPGAEYELTRHNVGWMVLDRLAQELSARRPPQWRPVQRPAPAFYAEGRSNTDEVCLVKPQTMMNRSGEALAGLQVPAGDILVICDDVNLPLGRLRLRPGGSAGGHHGLQSCLEALQTKEVPRLRLGVGGGGGGRDLTPLVLSRFRPDEQPAVERMIARAAQACHRWVVEGMEEAMNQYNPDELPDQRSPSP